MNLPNKITLFRIVLVFIFLVFLFCPGVAAKVMALIVFIIAAISDYLDGYIAKKHNIVTNFGKIMDPIADKIGTLAAFLAFVEMKLIPAWTVVIIILRDLIITGIRLMALAQKEVLPAGRGGKHKTFSQAVAIFVILVFIIIKEAGVTVSGFWDPGWEYWYRQLIWIMMLITVALTIISGVSYLITNKKFLLGEKNG